ncbi:oxidoreductase [Mycena filopes]|nr:oxidoreductase [Mycena filopes]KAJ7157769.1 oxidoreductase [Mycena filopes]
MSTTKKVALVTGSSEGGIGFAMCQQLVEKDYIVYATSRSTSSTQALTHPNIKRLALDVKDDASVNKAVATAIEESGHIDLLINNAGLFAVGPIVDWTGETAKDIYDTNVVSIVRMCAAVFPHMAKRKSGTILNMGSVVGEYGTPWSGLYDSSKAAVRAISEDLYLECKPFNVHVMHAAPGTIHSKLADKQADYELPSGSLYGRFAHNVMQRLEASRDDKAMNTDAFAKLIISKATRAKPPRYFRAGGYTELYAIFGLLPRGVVLWIVWKMFSGAKK